MAKIDVNILRYWHDFFLKHYFFSDEACTLAFMEIIRAANKNPWRLFCWLLVAGCILTIFTFSGQDGAESAGVSARVTHALMVAFSDGPIDENSARFELAHHLVRKAAHATLYCALALSCAGLTHTYPLKQKARYLIAAGACLVCASADEIQQTFRSGRVGAVTDVLIDMGGALLGLALFALVWALARRPRGDCRRA